MDFEWDETKRLENLRRRGVDFVWAAQVFDDPDRLAQRDSRRDYGEQRIRTLGTIEGVPYAVVNTMRGGTCRITAWKAGRNDRRKCQAFHHGSDTPDD
jgi:uncharacterized DUF497 family protein